MLQFSSVYVVSRADAWHMGTAGGKPEVKYIKGNAEQRGTNFRAAMTGDESFRR
jgi:hypothetical protein